MTPNTRFAYDRFGFRATAAVQGTNTFELTSWSQLSNVASELPNWDGSVAVGEDFEEIAALLAKGQAPTGYLDERVVCGGIPGDIPWMLSDMFDEFVDKMVKIFKAPRWVKGQFASTLALAWRAAGYPKVNEEGLLEIAKEHYPALTQVVKAPSGAWWAPNAIIRGLEVYKAQEVDAFEIAQLLTRHGSKTTTAEALGKVRDGMLAIRNFEDRLVAVGSTKTSPRVQTRPDNDKILGWVEHLVQEAINNEFELADGFCYKCKTNSVKCRCPKGAKDFQAMVKQAMKSRGGEHRWGDVYASRPTVESIINAGKGSGEVRAKMVALHGENLVAEWEGKLGRAVWFDISIFLEQCHQKVDSLEADVSGMLMVELLGAQKRVESVHDYAPTLYEEFEGPDAQLSGKYTEVYLGRDAIFAYFARWAQRAAMRASTPLEERYERFADLSEIRYTVVSRTAKWISGVHTPKLGSYPAVFIDTGFSGSIPRAIAQEEHLHIVDRPGKKAASVTLVSGLAQVRLMNTTNRGYQFVRQWTTAAVNEIEMDAKPTVTASAVDEAAPTGAVEQLVFRVLRRGISNLSYQKTQELLAKGGGRKRILSLEDAMAFVAEQKSQR